MAVNYGPKHGKHSRDFCRLFLDKNNLNENDYEDVLETIENHDRKGYASETGRNDLLTVLSVADDLDAFGFTGIYRYSEIYLARGVKPVQIGHLVLENAGRRFKNFENIFGVQNYYVQFHQKRYKILSNFFNQYNIEADCYNFNTNDPEGHCGVIQLFMLLINNKMTINELFNEAETYQNDVIIGPFLTGLKSELL
jgi:hypothetical protein